MYIQNHFRCSITTSTIRLNPSISSSTVDSNAPGSKLHPTYTGRAMRRARILAMRVVYSTLDEVYSVVLRTDRELVRLKRK